MGPAWTTHSSCCSPAAALGFALSQTRASMGCRIQQLKRASAAMSHLVHRARGRRLIRTPPEKLRAVPETVARKVVILNFDDELGFERLPFVRPALVPA